jgi:hypothetical protein
MRVVTQGALPRPALGQLEAFVIRELCAVGAALAAGVIAGAVVAGLGGRLAMRIIGILAGADAAGAVTANGNVVGEITVLGTLGLVGGGAFLGLFVGVLYAVARAPLAPLGRWRPLVFGILMLAVYGSAVISPENRDFRRFGPAPVSVSLFAALIVLLGAWTATLASAFDARLAPPTARPLSIAGFRLATLVAAVLAVPAVLATWNTAVSIVRVLILAA